MALSFVRSEWNCRGAREAFNEWLSRADARMTKRTPRNDKLTGRGPSAASNRDPVIMTAIAPDFGRIMRKRNGMVSFYHR